MKKERENLLNHQ